MKVNLKTEIPVVKYAAFAELSWLERQPELGLLCREAGEELMSAEVVQSILPGVSEPAAQNIIDWCTHLGLCDRYGALTAIGVEAGNSDLAPKPEQGVYEFWVAKHSLLGTRILHANRLVSKRDQRFDDIQTIPMSPETNTIFQSLIDPEQRLTLRKFTSNHGEPSCLRWEGSRSRLMVHWRWEMNSSSNTWALDGHLDAGSVKHCDESVAVDIWQLFSQLARQTLQDEGSWDVQDRHLATSFKALNDDEIESFRASFELTGFIVPGYGPFQSGAIEDVPLKPATQRDAQQWALARLHNRLSDGRFYRSREGVRQLWDELIEGTPLAPFQPELPSHDQLLASASDPAVYWSLAAPVDLSAAPVPPSILGPMPFDGVL